MISLQSRLLVAWLRWSKAKSSVIIRMTTDAGRPLAFAQPDMLKDRYHIETKTVQGRNVYKIQARDARNRSGSGTVVLYLHGGAYISTFLKKHWRFIDQMIRETGCTVIAPDYPLAPEDTYRETISMVSEVYTSLAKDESAERIIFLGDSAGGGLALAIARKFRDEDCKKPAHIILLSPWLDVTCGNPEMKNIDRMDPFIEPVGFRMAGLAYAGGDDPTNPLISPLYADLEGVSPLTVFTGTRDILNVDARALKEKAEQSGVRLEYYEYPGMIHNWILFQTPEAGKARKIINRLITVREGITS